jgi:NADH:ubiquinone oxidoreductase subunit H
MFFFCGWGSGSKYSMVGTYRSVSQVISYEVRMLVFILFLVFYLFSYDFFDYSFFQVGWWFGFFFFHLFFCWVVVCFAESNRVPFDFSEGESELVSGFNVEYGGGLFSLIFICEYGFLIFLSSMRVVFFCGCFSFWKFGFFCFLFVWVRCSFPRYRYDKLMGFAWCIFLPFSISVLFCSYVF